MKLTSQTNVYSFEVDGKPYASDSPKITAAEIMQKAGILQSQGLIQILDDGQQVQLDPSTIIDLAESEKRFKKPPKFKRG